MKIISYILSLLLFFIIIIVTCISARPSLKNLSDSDIMNIVEVVLDEIFNNYEIDVEQNFSRYPEFYDLYAKGIRRDEFYSGEYWLDFGSYFRSFGYAQGWVIYQYIFILPRDNIEYFYIATNYYSLSIPGSFTDRKLEFEVFECNSDDLVNIKNALLHETDPEILNCRSLGILKVSNTNNPDNPFEYNIIQIE
jgi:hypothetical protein